MTPDKEREAARICEAALDRPASERDALILKECAGDNELRREVESLLRQLSKADEFLQRPAMEEAAAQAMALHALVVGQQVGPYQIQGRLGAGGMGEVYRAHDTKLGRDVAIKVLPRIFTSDRERLARFEREARLLAALNHPSIGAIHGLEDVDGVAALVLELVEGRTLADRLANGAIPIQEALNIASQIAAALEAAHEKGIVHRDLKPANVVLTIEGQVKVLDFGLAKALAGGASDLALSPSATISAAGVDGGIILGTAAYMSPEQAGGQVVDKRMDIWAFGCVLFEMLTGRRAFEGDSISEILARVIEREPPWKALPPALHPRIHELLRRCLEKDRNRRLRDIADARFQIEEALAPTDWNGAELQWVTRRGTAKAAAPRGWSVIAGLALGLAALVPATLYLRRAPVDAHVTRFEMPAPGFVRNLVIAPDGRTVAYVASHEGRQAIWTGPVGSLTARQLNGTDNASGLFWSPDSRYLGFVAEGNLKKIAVSGGEPQVVCDSSIDLPGTWNRDDVILFGGFAGGAAGVLRVSASGGDVTMVTVADVSKEFIHVQPQFLPDGRHFIYHAVDSNQRDGALYVGSLDSKSTTRLMAIPNSWHGTNSPASYAAPGRLLFSRDGRLMAQGFDPVRRTLSGEPSAVDENVRADFSVSENGLLVYRKVTDQKRRQPVPLAWFDRTGSPTGQVATPINAESLSLSPDGQQVAVDNAGPAGSPNSDVWVIGLTRGAPLKLTADAGFTGFPIWDPHGNRIVFGAIRAGRVVSKLYQKRADGVGAEALLLPGDSNDIDVPQDWSSDGRYIVFSRFRFDAKSANDVWFLPLFGDKKPSLFLQTSFPKVQSQLSPNGRYLAYVTNESDTYQIVVQSFPDPTIRRWHITAQGGTEPSWRRDGRELYYLALDGKLMAVRVESNPTFTFGKPTPLFQTALTQQQPIPVSRRYVTADGQRFLMISPLTVAAVDKNATPITVSINWSAPLQK